MSASRRVHPSLALHGSWSLRLLTRVLLAALVLLSASLVRAGDARVVVASKSFSESRLLGEMFAQLLEAHTDLEVVRKLGLGSTQICFAALQAGEIDLYPEYTGTAWAVLLKRPEAISDSTRTYLEVDRESQRRWDLDWLMPLGFNNTYALAMREEMAERLGITKVSQLGPHLANLEIGMNHEFLERMDGFRGLTQAYGFEVPEGLKGVEHGLAYEGLGKGVIDLVDAYSTDGKLLRYPVRTLEDDLEFFPPYHAAPVIRGEVARRHPEVIEVVERLAYTLPDRIMQRLNYQVEVEGGSFPAVARGFLGSRGLVGATGSPGGTEPGSTAPPSPVGPGGLAPPPERLGLGEYLLSRLDETLLLTLQHLRLTLAAVSLAILFAVPLGILLSRRRQLAPPVLGLAGVVQTIPSLALLALMIPIPGLGLGATSAIAALFLYAILPILRNTYTGLVGVDPNLVEAAVGMGLKDREVLTHIQLPLASRTIMAGIRTSTVISIGVATLAAFIGAGGLGDPILTGLQLNDMRLVISGALPAALLAIFTDMALGRLEEWVAPEGVRRPGEG